ncbi:MAG: MFS transporter [Candidatus Thermoplasmatota archaeon]|jgi:MFS family permease|nr:MFS transporter [Candidatus Thermoplasmatota archaeon]MCL5681232.1 MFS transporter [Candidatus Thermoplasmatota archaeon]
MFSESQDKIDASFPYLLISRSARSIALVFVSLAFSLYLHSLGYSLVLIGVLYLFIVLFNIFLSLAIGIIGDRIGYAKALILGELFPLIGLAGLALSTNIYLIALYAIVGGISGTAGGLRGAFSPGMTAFVASNWPEEMPRIHRLANINVVASLSSIVGGFLVITHDYLNPYFGSAGTFRILFAVSFLILLVSFVSLFMLKEKRRPRKTTKVMKKESFSYTMRIIAANMINGAAIGIAIPLLPLWFELRYHLTVSYVGEIFTLAYAATALGSYISGKYLNSVKISAIGVSSVTRFFQGLLMVVLAFSPFVTIAFLLYALRSGIAGIGAPMRSAISVRGIGKEDYGTASSIQGIATRGSQSTSGLSGYLMDLYMPSPLLIGGLIQISGSFVYYRIIRNWEMKKGNWDVMHDELKK